MLVLEPEQLENENECRSLPIRIGFHMAMHCKDASVENDIVIALAPAHATRMNSPILVCYILRIHANTIM